MTVTITFGNKEAGELDIGLLGRIGNTPIQKYEYTLTDRNKPNETFKGEILHDCNDGMWALVATCMRHALATWPDKLVCAPGGRNRAQCPECKEVVESLYRHDYRACKCGKTFVDGGRDYRRCTTGAVSVPPDNWQERRLRMLAVLGPVELTLTEGPGIFRISGSCQGHTYVLAHYSLDALLLEAGKRCVDIGAGRKIVGEVYRVHVRAKLVRGATPESAETDGWYKKTCVYDITAANDEDACEQALDRFHSTIPIGVLDDVEVTATAFKPKAAKPLKGNKKA